MTVATECLHPKECLVCALRNGEFTDEGWRNINYMLEKLEEIKKMDPVAAEMAPDKLNRGLLS